MISTSRMCGTSVSVVRPSASSAAAITLSTLFLAPVTRTSPASRAPPTTRNLSMRGHRRASPGMVNLTRIYTRTGDDGTTGYGGRGPHQQERPPPRGLRRLRRGRRVPRCGAGVRRPDRRRRGRADPGAERPLRRRCGPLHPVADRPGVPAAAGRAGPGRRRSSARSTASTPTSSRCGRSSSPAVRRLPPTCTSPAPSYAGPSGRPGAASRRTGHSEPADREVPEPALGPAVRPGPATPTARPATCSGCPAPTAEGACGVPGGDGLDPGQEPGQGVLAHRHLDRPGAVPSSARPPRPTSSENTSAPCGSRRSTTCRSRRLSTRRGRIE